MRHLILYPPCGIIFGDLITCHPDRNNGLRYHLDNTPWSLTTTKSEDLCRLRSLIMINRNNDLLFQAKVCIFVYVFLCLFCFGHQSAQEHKAWKRKERQAQTS